jgi:RNA polymerase sigma factor (sigma-70 family)
MEFLLPAQKTTKKRSEGDILEEILRVVRRLEEQTTPSVLSSRFISEILSTLTPREEKVLRLRYGIEREKMDHTLEEIGSDFGLTREHVRQIEKKALKKLRHPRASKGR